MYKVVVVLVVISCNFESVAAFSKSCRESCLRYCVGILNFNIPHSSKVRGGSEALGNNDNDYS